MRTRLSFKEGSSADHEALTRLIEDWSGEHLDPMLTKFGFANAELAAVVDKRAKGANRYRVKLHLHVPPRKVLVARADGNDLTAIARDALERIRRELKRHIDRVRHQEAYKRKARRKRLHEQKARVGALAPEAVTQVETRVEPLRPRLERVIRRELAYLRAQGDLSPDYPTVQDVLDEVLLAVKADWNAGEEDETLYPRMLKAMHEVLDREVKASRVYGEAVSLERAPQEDAEEQAEEMVGEEFTEFWQPDEALHVEDIVPSGESTDPEQELEEVEERAEEALYLMELMRALPIDWRRALLLHEVDGVGVDALALSFDCPEQEVQGWIDNANTFLDARLQEAGLEGGARRLLGRIGEASGEG